MANHSSIATAGFPLTRVHLVIALVSCAQASDGRRCHALTVLIRLHVVRSSHAYALICACNCRPPCSVHVVTALLLCCYHVAKLLRATLLCGSGSSMLTCSSCDYALISFCSFGLCVGWGDCNFGPRYARPTYTVRMH